jgi:sn-glycerol 3-phosphate transport system permease protein
MIISPILVTGLAALAGAMAMMYASGRRGGQRWLSGLLGAAGGGLGASLFMVPLEYCTFEEARRPIDHAFGGLLVVAGMLIVLLPTSWIARRLLWRHRAVSDGVHGPTHGLFKGWLTPLLFLLPTLTILITFLYYPSLDTLRLSTRLARLGARREAFVCVDNFTRLVELPSYIDSIGRTLFMSAMIVVLSMGLALLVALVAYLPIRGATVYRTLLIWPYGISPAVAGIIFLLMFNPTGGIINHLTNDLLGFKIGWTNDPAVAPWTIILASVWKSMGFNILFYIAGLQNVPRDLLEAASIDGANVFQRFRNILLPLLSPITFFLIVTNVTYAVFETYATIDYLTPGGGPLQSTTTMMYDVIQLGVANNDLGKAAAQSIVLFMLVIGLTLVQFRVSGRRVTFGA